MTELNLATFNDAVHRMVSDPHAQLIAEQAFEQAHRFCNDHLHLDGEDTALTKSDILATLMNDMSDEILTKPNSLVNKVS
jgi:hypothetical protein